MNEEDSRDIVNIFLKKKAPSILESEEFRNWENEKYSALLFNKRLKKQVDNIKRDLQLSQQQT